MNVNMLIADLLINGWGLLWIIYQQLKALADLRVNDRLKY